jgi:transcriptional regulator with XRE-family HTH domain
MKDLADFLQDEVDATSVRAVAKRIDIAKTTVQNIVKRALKTAPETQTLEKIAAAYGLTLPAVLEMTGMMIGDKEKFVKVAHELEQSPWIEKRLDELLSLNEQEFNYWLDWVKWRREHGDGSSLPPPTQ